MKVDSHHHFWNPDRRDCYWMEGEAFDLMNPLIFL